MCVPCSFHNLAEFEALNYDLATHYYALKLLVSVPDEERDSSYSRLLYERVSVMSDTVFSLKLLERCILGERDFNSDGEDSPEAPASSYVPGA